VYNFSGCLTVSSDPLGLSVFRVDLSEFIVSKSDGFVVILLSCVMSTVFRVCFLSFDVILSDNVLHIFTIESVCTKVLSPLLSESISTFAVDGLGSISILRSSSIVNCEPSVFCASLLIGDVVVFVFCILVFLVADIFPLDCSCVVLFLAVSMLLLSDNIDSDTIVAEIFPAVGKCLVILDGVSFVLLPACPDDVDTIVLDLLAVSGSIFVVEVSTFSVPIYIVSVVVCVDFSTSMLFVIIDLDFSVGIFLVAGVLNALLLVPSGFSTVVADVSTMDDSCFGIDDDFDVSSLLLKVSRVASDITTVISSCFCVVVILPSLSVVTVSTLLLLSSTVWSGSFSVVIFWKLLFPLDRAFSKAIDVDCDSSP